MTKEEADLIATAANVLRPSWPAKSISTQLMDRHAHRPARQVLLALMWLVLDPATNTPGRLNENGPWWSFQEIRPQDRARPVEMKCPEHPDEIQPCPVCVPNDPEQTRSWREIFAITNGDPA